MHELSIAMNIVELAEEAALKKNAISISRVALDIGSLSGIEYDALTFAMEEAVKDSMLAKASIEYNIIEAVAVCEDCCNEFVSDDYFKTCPICNSLNTSLIKGKELKIKAIDIETND